MIKERDCRQCGIVFQGGPRAWYCPDCRHVRRLESQARMRKYGAKRPIGSSDSCIACNNKYIVQSGNQKYCKDCAPEEIAKMDNQLSLEYYNKNKDTINPKRYKARKKERWCVICGNKLEPNTQKITCSEECHKQRIRQHQRKSDKKRRTKKKATSLT